MLWFFCSQSQAVEAATRAAERQSSLTIGIDSDAVALDPLRVNDTLTMSILSNVYEPLVRMNNDSEIVPALATKWETSDDGLEYTFLLCEQTQPSTMEILSQQRM